MAADDFNEFAFYAKHYWQRFRPRILVAVVIIVVLWLGSSVLYSVPADSRAVVLRLGAFSRQTDPGLHAKLPWPFEKEYLVPTERAQTLEFGFETLQPGRVTQYAPTSDADTQVSLMLTGDLNLAVVSWTVQYQIKDARQYMFEIGGTGNPEVDVPDTIRDVSEAVMRKLVGDASVDEVITIGRESIAMHARDEIQAMLDAYTAGVQINNVKLQDASPPDEVKDAFEAVNQARQDKERVINDALGEKNRKVPAARGQRDRLIAEARGYKSRVVQNMQGRTEAFLSQLAEYEKAPDVTRARLYLEAMEDVLGSVDRKVVLDEAVQGMLPLLDLERISHGKGGAQ